MSQGSGATGPASAPLDPELPEPPPEPEPPLEPELPLDAVPDELPLEPEPLWVPEPDEPLPDAGASPDPPSSLADVVLPDELPAPVESPPVDEAPHAAIHGGAIDSPRITERARQFIEDDLTVGGSSRFRSGNRFQIGVRRFETCSIDDSLSVRRKSHHAEAHVAHDHVRRASETGVRVGGANPVASVREVAGVVRRVRIRGHVAAKVRVHVLRDGQVGRAFVRVLAPEGPGQPRALALAVVLRDHRP